jgi:CcmD family protein
MENIWYLFAAYTVIWVALWGFILRLARREKLLSKKIESLRVRLAKRDGNRQEH